MGGIFLLRRVLLAAVVAGAVCNFAVASADATSISTTPSMYPAFSPSTTDYVIRGCPTTGGITVNVTTDPGQYISVDGQTAQTGTFSANVNVTTGQEFTVATNSGSETMYARCLPSGFPNFTSTVTGPVQTQYFLTVPNGTGAATNYVTMFDAHGVPVWWYPVTGSPLFANYKPNGDIAYTTQGGSDVNIITLSGTPDGTVSSPDGPIDFHEYQTLSNGDSLVEVDEYKCCTDLSSWGAAFPTNANIYDQVIEVITPTGQVVWSWDALAHINPVVETAQQWIPDTLLPSGGYDVFHMNSVDYKNGIFLVSFRHLNAVYAISQATGQILYKLGGHTDPQSLTVLNDPVFSSGGGFCGQHDARFAWNNTITLHDNGSYCGRGPRAVDYAINTSAMTATLVGSMSDSRAPSSTCCGSVTWLRSGDLVASWGYNDYFTELNASSTPVYTVQWTDPGVFSYRVTPITGGFYTAAQLRAGMNAQYPRAAVVRR